jgi:nitroreductase
MIKDIVSQNRSYRRFYQSEIPSEEDLFSLVDLARLAPSGANRQPLKFFISNDPETNSEIFPCLAWAGYLKKWAGPEEGERPSAYIVVLGDKTISETFGHDPGIAAQTIMLGAVEKGFGGCMIGNVSREKLRKLLDIPEQFEIILVLALGKPKESVVIETLSLDDSVEYWRDGNHVHHVPKRKLEDIVIRNQSLA